MDSIADDSTISEVTGLSTEVATFADIAYSQAQSSFTIDHPWEPGTPAHDFYELVEAAVLRPVGFDSKLDQGSKLVANLRHLNISAAIHGFLIAQNPECPLTTPSAAVLFYLSSGSLHPWHVLVLPRADFAASVKAVFPRSIFAEHLISAINGTLPADAEMCVPLRETAARRQLTIGNLQKAHDYLQIDLSGAEHLPRQRLAPLLTITLLRLQRLQDAITRNVILIGELHVLKNVIVFIAFEIDIQRNS